MAETARDRQKIPIALCGTMSPLGARGGNSTFDAARISRFEVTRVAVPKALA